ncbi:MAG: heavy-metal-associated domain-containing protein [Verrucomicrobia bacterium]|nr:heavy-metal-associated domain-containing protein [Verrucomicrobiota bacterium]
MKTNVPKTRNRGWRPTVPRPWTAILLAVGLWNTPSAIAQIQNASVKVDGLACPFCAYGLEKQLKRIPGVTKAETDLKDGRVNLAFTKKKQVTVTELQQAVQKAGFSVSAVTVTAIGSIVEEDGLLVLQVRALGQRFLLFENAAREQAAHDGKQGKLLTEKTEAALKQLLKAKVAVSVTGYLHDHAEGPAGLNIQNFEETK